MKLCELLTYLVELSRKLLLEAKSKISSECLTSQTFGAFSAFNLD